MLYPGGSFLDAGLLLTPRCQSHPILPTHFNSTNVMVYCHCSVKCGELLAIKTYVVTLIQYTVQTSITCGVIDDHSKSFKAIDKCVFTNFRDKNAVFTNLRILVLFICICIYLYLIFGLIVYISKIQLSVSKFHSLITLLKSLPDEPVK